MIWSPSIHDRARALSAQRGISIHAAYSMLGKAGAARRRARAALDAFSAPAPIAWPKPRLWYVDES